MPKITDILGTIRSGFQIGLKTATVQARSMFFRSQFVGTLVWTTTADRTLTLPDTTGLLVTKAQLDEVSMIGTPYHNTSAANTTATISITAPGAGLSLQLNSLIFSYSAAPTNGLLTVANGATVYAEVAITAAGAGPALAGIKLPVNTPATITLLAGGDGVIGRVSASISVV